MLVGSSGGVRSSLFYLGLGLIFASGLSYSLPVAVAVSDLVWAVAQMRAPESVTEAGFSSYATRTNSVPQALHGTPLLATGPILARRHGGVRNGARK